MEQDGKKDCADFAFADFLCRGLSDFPGEPAISQSEDMDRRAAGYNSGGELQDNLFELAVGGRCAAAGALSGLLHVCG